MICPKCGYITKHRSNQQNKYYFGVVLKILSDELGYDVEEIHELMKFKFNSTIICVGKDETRVGLSTSNLKTMEFETYISKIVMWASQNLGIIIPMPDEEKNESKN